MKSKGTGVGKNSQNVNEGSLGIYPNLPPAAAAQATGRFLPGSSMDPRAPQGGAYSSSINTSRSGSSLDTARSAPAELGTPAVPPKRVSPTDNSKGVRDSLKWDSERYQPGARPGSGAFNPAVRPNELPVAGRPSGVSSHQGFSIHATYPDRTPQKKPSASVVSPVQTHYNSRLHYEPFLKKFLLELLTDCEGKKIDEEVGHRFFAEFGFISITNEFGRTTDYRLCLCVSHVNGEPNSYNLVHLVKKGAKKGKDTFELAKLPIDRFSYDQKLLVFKQLTSFLTQKSYDVKTNIYFADSVLGFAATNYRKMEYEERRKLHYYNVKPGEAVAIRMNPVSLFNEKNAIYHSLFFSDFCNKVLDAHQPRSLLGKKMTSTDIARIKADIVQHVSKIYTERFNRLSQAADITLPMSDDSSLGNAAAGIGGPSNSDTTVDLSLAWLDEAPPHTADETVVVNSGSPTGAYNRSYRGFDSPPRAAQANAHNPALQAGLSPIPTPIHTSQSPDPVRNLMDEFSGPRGSGAGPSSPPFTPPARVKNSLDERIDPERASLVEPTNLLLPVEDLVKVRVKHAFYPLPKEEFDEMSIKVHHYVGKINGKNVYILASEVEDPVCYYSYTQKEGLKEFSLNDVSDVTALENLATTTLDSIGSERYGITHNYVISVPKNGKVKRVGKDEGIFSKSESSDEYCDVYYYAGVSADSISLKITIFGQEATFKGFPNIINNTIVDNSFNGFIKYNVASYVESIFLRYDSIKQSNGSTKRLQSPVLQKIADDIARSRTPIYSPISHPISPFQVQRGAAQNPQEEALNEKDVEFLRDYLKKVRVINAQKSAEARDSAAGVFAALQIDSEGGAIAPEDRARFDRMRGIVGGRQDIIGPEHSGSSRPNSSEEAFLARACFVLIDAIKAELNPASKIYPKLFSPAATPAATKPSAGYGGRAGQLFLDDPEDNEVDPEGHENAAAARVPTEEGAGIESPREIKSPMEHHSDSDEDDSSRSASPIPISTPSQEIKEISIVAEKALKVLTRADSRSQPSRRSKPPSPENSVDLSSDEVVSSRSLSGSSGSDSKILPEVESPTSEPISPTEEERKQLLESVVDIEDAHKYSHTEDISRVAGSNFSDADSTESEARLSYEPLDSLSVSTSGSLSRSYSSHPQDASLGLASAEANHLETSAVIEIPGESSVEEEHTADVSSEGAFGSFQGGLEWNDTSDELRWPGDDEWLPAATIKEGGASENHKRTGFEGLDKAGRGVSNVSFDDLSSDRPAVDGLQDEAYGSDRSSSSDDELSEASRTFSDALGLSHASLKSIPEEEDVVDGSQEDNLGQAKEDSFRAPSTPSGVKCDEKAALVVGENPSLKTPPHSTSAREEGSRKSLNSALHSNIDAIVSDIDKAREAMRKELDTPGTPQKTITLSKESLNALAEPFTPPSSELSREMKSLNSSFERLKEMDALRYWPTDEDGYSASKYDLSKVLRFDSLSDSAKASVDSAASGLDQPSFDKHATDRTQDLGSVDDSSNSEEQSSSINSSTPLNSPTNPVKNEEHMKKGTPKTPGKNPFADLSLGLGDSDVAASVSTQGHETDSDGMSDEGHSSRSSDSGEWTPVVRRKGRGANTPGRVVSEEGLASTYSSSKLGKPLSSRSIPSPISLPSKGTLTTPKSTSAKKTPEPHSSSESDNSSHASSRTPTPNASLGGSPSALNKAASPSFEETHADAITSPKGPSYDSNFPALSRQVEEPTPPKVSKKRKHSSANSSFSSPTPSDNDVALEDAGRSPTPTPAAAVILADDAGVGHVDDAMLSVAAAIPLPPSPLPQSPRADDDIAATVDAVAAPNSPIHPHVVDAADVADSDNEEGDTVPNWANWSNIGGHYKPMPNFSVKNAAEDSSVANPDAANPVFVSGDSYRSPLNIALSGSSAVQGLGVADDANPSADKGTPAATVADPVHAVGDGATIAVVPVITPLQQPSLAGDDNASAADDDFASIDDEDDAAPAAATPVPVNNEEDDEGLSVSGSEEIYEEDFEDDTSSEAEEGNEGVDEEAGGKDSNEDFEDETSLRAEEGSKDSDEEIEDEASVGSDEGDFGQAFVVADDGSAAAVQGLNDDDSTNPVSPPSSPHSAAQDGGDADILPADFNLDDIIAHFRSPTSSPEPKLEGDDEPRTPPKSPNSAKNDAEPAAENSLVLSPVKSTKDIKHKAYNEAYRGMEQKFLGNIEETLRFFDKDRDVLAVELARATIEVPPQIAFSAFADVFLSVKRNYERLLEVDSELKLSLAILKTTSALRSLENERAALAENSFKEVGTLALDCVSLELAETEEKAFELRIQTLPFIFDGALKMLGYSREDVLQHLRKTEGYEPDHEQEEHEEDNLNSSMTVDLSVHGEREEEKLEVSLKSFLYPVLCGERGLKDRIDRFLCLNEKEDSQRMAPGLVGRLFVKAAEVVRASNEAALRGMVRADFETEIQNLTRYTVVLESRLRALQASSEYLRGLEPRMLFLKAAHNTAVQNAQKDKAMFEQAAERLLRESHLTFEDLRGIALDLERKSNTLFAENSSLRLHFQHLREKDDSKKAELGTIKERLKEVMEANETLSERAALAGRLEGDVGAMRAKIEEIQSGIEKTLSEMEREFGDKLTKALNALNAKHEEDLARQSSEFADKLSGLSGEKENLAAQLRALSEESAALRADNALKDGNISSVKSFIEEFGQREIAYTSEVQSLQSDLESYKSREGELTEREGRVAETMRSAQSRISEFVQKARDSEERAKVAEDKVEATRSALEASQAENSDLKDANRTLIGRVDGLVAEMSGLQSRHEADVARVEEKARDAEERAKVAEDKVEATRSALEASQAENSDLKDANRTLTDRVDGLVAEMSDLQLRHEADVARVEEKARDAEAKLDAAEREAEATRGALEENRAENDVLRGANGALAGQVDGLVAEMLDLQLRHANEVNALSEKVADEARKAKGFSDAISDAEGKAREALKRAENAEQELVKEKAVHESNWPTYARGVTEAKLEDAGAIAAKDAEISRLKAEVGEINGKLKLLSLMHAEDVSAARKQGLEQGISERQQEVDEYRGFLADVSGRLILSESENAALKKRAKDAKDAESKFAAEFALLREESDRLITKNGNLEAEFASLVPLREENTRLTTRNSSLEEGFTALKEENGQLVARNKTLEAELKSITSSFSERLTELEDNIAQRIDAAVAAAVDIRTERLQRALEAERLKNHELTVQNERLASNIFPRAKGTLSQHHSELRDVSVGPEGGNDDEPPASAARDPIVADENHLILQPQAVDNADRLDENRASVLASGVIAEVQVQAAERMNENLRQAETDQSSLSNDEVKKSKKKSKGLTRELFKLFTIPEEDAEGLEKHLLLPRPHGSSRKNSEPEKHSENFMVRCAQTASSAVSRGVRWPVCISEEREEPLLLSFKSHGSSRKNSEPEKHSENFMVRCAQTASSAVSRGVRWPVCIPKEREDDGIQLRFGPRGSSRKDSKSEKPSETFMARCPQTVSSAVSRRVCWPIYIPKEHEDKPIHLRFGPRGSSSAAKRQELPRGP